MRLILAALAALLLSCVPAPAQHNHVQHHSTYQNWVNGKGAGCCNNLDCGTLADAAVRTEAGDLQVNVEGQWCPVMAWHYLTRGNAPDASSHHACVLRTWDGDTRTPCERFICYQPPAGG